MHTVSQRAVSTRLRARWRTIGAALAAGLVGPALIVIPALAQAGNQPPVANGDGFAIVQNTETVLTVLGNDTDPEGDTLSIASLSTPGHGTLMLSAGSLTYTPTAGYLGTDTFTYTISDGHGNASTARVNLIVSATIGVPVAQDDSVSVLMNTATSLNVLSNDSDPDGQSLTIASVTVPRHGTAVIVGAAIITYTPAAGFTGSDTFSYTAGDGFGSTDIAVVTVNVTNTGAAPIVQNDTANILMNTSMVLTVLANDSDPNGDVLTISSVTTPAHGTATITGGLKTVTYTPASGYVGVDSFSYTVSDGNGHTASGMVAIVVVGQHALLARNDRATTTVDTAKSIPVLSNDVASSGTNSLTVTAVTTPAHGTATIDSGAKKVTYTPASGFVGTDTFMYNVTETGGGTAAATVTVTVKPALNHDGDDDDDEDRDEDRDAKDACKNGGWFDLGFRNQGLCIAAVNHGLLAGIAGDRHHDDDDGDGEHEHRGRGARGNGLLELQVRESARASFGAWWGDKHDRGKRHGR